MEANGIDLNHDVMARIAMIQLDIEEGDVSKDQTIQVDNILRSFSLSLCVCVCVSLSVYLSCCLSQKNVLYNDDEIVANHHPDPFTG